MDKDSKHGPKYLAGKTPVHPFRTFVYAKGDLKISQKSDDFGPSFKL